MLSLHKHTLFVPFNRLEFNDFEIPVSCAVRLSDYRGVFQPGLYVLRLVFLR
jgi:hypothetical protein